MFECDAKGVLLSIATKEVREREVIQVSDPRAEYVGPTRGSVENNSPVMLIRPASDPLLAGHNLTRPVRFPSPLDPTRPVRL